MGIETYECSFSSILIVVRNLIQAQLSDDSFLLKFGASVVAVDNRTSTDLVCFCLFKLEVLTKLSRNLKVSNFSFLSKGA